MKVKKITVSNLKAIKDKTLNLDGATAIVTGKNNSGKTTLLRGLFDRFRNIKPDQVLRHGEEEGFAETELTSGEKLRWEFNSKNGKGFHEKLIYITAKEIKKSLTRELQTAYFPPTFDVDVFLNSQPKIQRRILQKLVGLDFADIDNRYEAAFDDRAGKNRKALEQKILFEDLEMPESAIKVDLTALLAQKEDIRKELNDLYIANKTANDEMRKKWNAENEKLRQAIIVHNTTQGSREVNVKYAEEALEKLIECGYAGEEVENFIGSLIRQYEQVKTYEPTPEPEYIKEKPDDAELVAIDEQIANTVENNRKAQLYDDYVAQRDKMQAAASDAADANAKVEAIERERMELIKKARMPEGFGFTLEGITYNGFPFTREQLSSSGIYIAALKLAAMTLGEVKTLHFDASFLDKNSLLEIEEWAGTQDLQLLIERPDFEGGEIEYQILQK